MGKFKVGDWVEITPEKDRKWKYWNNKHENMKGNPAEIERVEISKDGQKTFYYLRDLDGNGNWFLDHHMMMTPKQDRRFVDHMRKSCEKLQKHEKLCKKLRDEILEEVFVDEEDRLYQDFWDDDEVSLDDDLHEDWEQVETKPIVPLPGSRTKKGKTSTKQNTNSGGNIDTSNIDPADFMTDEEIQEYLDAIDGIDLI